MESLSSSQHEIITERKINQIEGMKLYNLLGDKGTPSTIEEYEADDGND
jgi:hypothetical protein